MAYKESSVSTKDLLGQKSLNSSLMKGYTSFGVWKMLFYFPEQIVGYAADIQKFYNSEKLAKSDWPLHLAFGRSNSDPEEEQVVFVLKVLFYGVTSTAGICNAAMDIMIEPAEKLGLEDVARAVRKAYVDDINGFVKTEGQARKLKEDLPKHTENFNFYING